MITTAKMTAIRTSTPATEATIGIKGLLFLSLVGTGRVVLLHELDVQRFSSTLPI